MLSTRWLQRQVLVLTLMGSVIPTAYGEPTPAPANETLSCVESLCGAQNPLSHPFEISKATEKWTNAMIKGNMQKPLQDYMGRIIHRALIADKVYKSILQKKIELQPEQAAFIQTFRYAKRINSYLPAIERGTYYGYSFNTAKLKEILPQATEDEINAITLLADVITLNVRIGRLMEMSYESMMNAIQPGKSVRDGQIAEAYNILLADEKLRRLMPLDASIKSDQLVLTKALKGDTLSAAEQLVMKDSIKSRFSIEALLDDSLQKAFGKIPLNMDLAMSEAGTAYAQSETAKALATPTSVKGFLQQGVEACSTKLAYAYAALPRQAQIDTFKKMLNDVKATARGMMEERTKTSLPNAFNAEIYLPTAREVSISDWKSSLTMAKNSADLSIATLKKLDLSDPRNLQAVAMAFVISAPDKLFSEVLSFCEKVQPPFLSDSAARRTGAINLSWPTIVHPEVGISIIAHEIGHVASYNWSENLKAEKDCLTARQGGTQYLEEDFADLFSAEVFNRSKGKIADVNMAPLGCGLLSRDKNTWALGDLVAVKGDTHSSNFYRLLSGATMTSRMTPQCGDYLKAKNVTQFDNYCQWQK